MLSNRDAWTQILLPDNYTLGWVADFLLSDKQTLLAGGAMPRSRISYAADRTPFDAPKHANREGGLANHRGQSAPLLVTKDIAPKTPLDATTPPSQSSIVGLQHEQLPTNQASVGTTVSGDKDLKSSSGDAATAADTQPHPKTAGKPSKNAQAKTKELAADSKPAPAKRATATHATVGVYAINRRAKAGRGGRVIGQLHRGDRVKLLDQHNGWRYVQAPGDMKAWVAGYLLVMPKERP